MLCLCGKLSGAAVVVARAGRGRHGEYGSEQQRSQTDSAVTYYAPGKISEVSS